MVRAIMWKLSIEDDQGQSTVVQLVRSEYSVGRTEENSIRLTERNISRRHAQLLKRGAAWVLADLGSYNGCFVNGLRVVEHHPVNVGDLIQIGDYRLELLADEGVAVAPTQPVRPRRADTLSTTLNLAAQTDRLVQVVGPTPGREYMLAHAAQRVGRGEECDICVNHSSVSRWHADLHFVGSSRYEIIDHGSSNGIRINGVDLRRGLLDARDLVELGDVVLKFIPAGQVYRPSPEESKQLAALLGVDLEGPEPGGLEKMGFAWRSLSGATRWVTLLLGLTVVVLLVVSQRDRFQSLGLSPEIFSRQAQPDPNQTLLDEAKALEAKGNAIAAHQKLSGIAAASPLRQDPAFSMIEKRWAQTSLTKAAKSASLDERRALLDAVAKAPTVEGSIRSQASDELAKLTADATSVATLPSSTPPVTAESMPIAADDPDTGTRHAAAIPSAADPSAADPSANGDSAAKSAMALKGVTASATPNQLALQKAGKRPNTPRVSGSGVGSGVGTGTGKTPGATTGKSGTGSSNEPTAAELATSGNIESLKAARDALRRKVAAGTATDREVRLLRALCRQLGDTTCPR